MRQMSIILLSVLLLGIAGGPPPTAVRAQTLQVRPRFEQAPCPFTLGPGMVGGTTVRCGYLVVPADRTIPNGRTIRLAVAIFKSPSPTPAPDPAVFLQGGPGLPLLSIAAHVPLQALFATFAQRSNRDIIMLDQRGTGYSQQALGCPELAAVHYRPIVQDRPLDQNLSPGARLALLIRAERQCRDRLVHAGIDLAAYTVAADAADVRDLRLALGYTTWNLYGNSYGTRVAQAAMRLDPAGIRSVVLDSALPLQRTAPFDILPQTARAFGTVFAECAADAACTAAYPHLATVFDRVVARLNAHPVRLPVVAMSARGPVPTGRWYPVPATGENLVETTFSLLQGGAARMMPRMIFDLQKGDTTLFAQAYAGTQSSLPISAGTYLSVVCSEDAPYTSPQQIVAAAQTLPTSMRSTFLPPLLGALRECETWDVPGVAATEKEPVRTAIPTLLLAGEHDPLTAPANALLIARGLHRSVTLTFPNTGHGVMGTDPCPDRIIAAFLDHPSTKPNAGCITGMRGFQFMGTGRYRRPIK